MDTALFNIFDLPMVLAIFVSLILASVLMVAKPRIERHLLLAIYLYAIALVELDKVIFWSMPVHRLFEPMIPAIFALGKGIGLLVPPLLYLYIRASNNTATSVSRSNAYLLIIPIFGALLSLLLYQSLGSNPGYYLPSNYRDIFFNDYLLMLMVCKYGLFFVFAILCIKVKSHLLTRNKKNSLISSESDKELNLIFVGALCIYGVEFLADFLAVLKSNGLLLNALGILHNYMVLFYVCLILASMLKRDLLKASCKSKKSSIVEQQTLDQEANKIHQLMMEHKYYLEPDMTLERLAKKLKMQEYQLSTLLNKNVQKNFFDFINYYRTEHAKQLMSSTMDKSYSILDILYDSGFNSKSAFNRCFKKYTGITPSEYRGKHKVISQ